MGFLIGSLVVSYFRTVYLALSSALRRFTVLFGMGRRGTTSLLPPGKAVCLVLNKLKEVWILKIAASLHLALLCRESSSAIGYLVSDTS